MPSSDSLFLAESEEQWGAALEEERAKGKALDAILSPPSLWSFYLRFQRHDFLSLQNDVTPLQLRLLLCAISTQVLQLAQTNRFIPSVDQQHAAEHIVRTESVSAMLRREELEGMLVKWRVLASQVLSEDVPPEISTWCKLMYHIVWLELLICHEDVQLLAGREGHDSGKPLLAHLQCWTASPLALKATAHAGQVFKAIRKSSGDPVRPPWWPLAVSRAALVLWCYAVGKFVAAKNKTTAVPILDVLMSDGAPLVPLYNLSDDDSFDGGGVQLIYRGDGVPCLLDSDGRPAPLYKVPEFFDVCIGHLDSGESLNFPIRDSVHQFLEDVRKCGIPY